MSETEISTGRGIPNEQKIDITGVLYPFLKTALKLWWLIIVLTAGLAAIAYFRTSTTYVPVYVASSTVSVSAGDGRSRTNSDSAQSASQLAKVFPYILTSGVLTDIVAEDLGLDSISDSISVTPIEDTTLLTISVTGEDAQRAYDILQSVIKNYPKVARYVVGNTTLSIIDDSGVPGDSGKVSVTRSNSIKAGLVGFLISLFIVWAYMITNRTIHDKNDLRTSVNAPYLGTLPVYRKKKRSNASHGILILEENVQSNYLEAIRTVRARLERQIAQTQRKVLMVTSSVPGEGKSTVAANLAISMAGKGKKVILIDCDMRNPSQQNVFDVQGHFPGLARVLLGEAKFSDSIYHFKYTHEFDLDIVFGSPEGGERSELLDSEEMVTLMNQLRRIYDVVILDTPPVGVVADAEMVTTYADSLLYVVRCDYARRSEVLSGIERVNEIGGKICGCVLNAGKTSSGGKYGNYGSYGYEETN